MREANLEVAQSKTELLAVLREHKAAVGSAVERNRSRNPRVYGPDYGGNERSVAIIVDVDADVDYNDLVNPSDIVDQSPPGHPIREAVAL
jgi:hypothetical protein